MRKVYVLIGETKCHQVFIVGVFASKKKAERQLKVHSNLYRDLNEYKVETYVLI